MPNMLRMVPLKNVWMLIVQMKMLSQDGTAMVVMLA